MKTEQDAQSIGWQLGADGVSTIVEQVERYCECEERRIALENHAAIVRLKAELSFLVEQEHSFTDRLRHEPPPGDLRQLRRRAIYSWCVTAALTIAGFALTLLAFDPYRLGWKSYVYCLGIAIVTPFLVEKVLDTWHSERFFHTLAAVACAAALASLMILAVIRGTLLAKESAATTPVVTVDDGSVPEVEEGSPDDFYKSTVPLLRVAMVFLALAMEIGAGLALQSAWRSSPDQSEDWKQLRGELIATRTRMAMFAAEITGLENESGIFAAAFWQDFYGAFLTNAARSAITKLSLLLLVFVLMPCCQAEPARGVDMVVAIDLTRSESVAGPDHVSEFRKNVQGVARLLAHVSAGTHVTIIGITDHSFAQPYILLSASVSPYPGYFEERLSAARTELVRKWKLRAARLAPDSPTTDVFGAVLLAGQIFSQALFGDRKTLVFFSDMRNSTPGLDLERERVLARDLSPTQSQRIPHVDLRHVVVYVLGVDVAGKSIAYWQELRQFWIGYFTVSGSDMKSFSSLRYATIH